MNGSRLVTLIGPLLVGLRVVLLAPALADAPHAGAEPFRPFDAIGIDFRAGASVPLEREFLDANGRSVMLGDIVDGRPVVLAPVYYRCPNLCTVTLTQLMRVVAHADLTPGEEFDVVAVSIDPREGPADATATRHALEAMPSAAALRRGVRFLTGDADDIEAVMTALGFRYRWDPATHQYAHASAVAVLTGDGKVARWLYGLGYRPKDLELAVVEAGAGRVGSLAERILLLCYHYDPTTGRYTGAVQAALRLAGLVTALALLVAVGLALRRERRGRAAKPGSTGRAR